MRRFWKVALIVAVIMFVSACTGLVAVAGADEEPEGAVAVCNWENFTQYGHDGYNAHWMACNWGLFGRVQCRGEAIPRCYTWAQARYSARAFRAYTGLG